MSEATAAFSDSSPTWSPDGTRIAFTSDRDGNAEICVVGADGSGARRLTSNPATDSAPAWSPDGTRIASVSDRDGQFGIWVMAPNGSDPSRLVPGPAVGDSRPAWSLDGRSIAFASDRDGPHLHIFVADVSGPGPPPWPTSSPDPARRASQPGLPTAPVSPSPATVPVLPRCTRRTRTGPT